MTESFRTYVTEEELWGPKFKDPPPPKRKRHWGRATFWGLVWAIIILVLSGHGETFLPAWAVMTVVCWFGGGEK